MKLYNSASKAKKLLPKGRPLTMWACGITPHDQSHLGHARSAITWDVLQRWVAHSGQSITFASNYTDIDDKIIARAARDGSLPEDIADRYIADYEELMALLNVQRPTYRPRVTDHIQDIQIFIQDLIDAGYAEEEDGSVYFYSDRHSGYGKFRSGTEAKFALWKRSPDDEPYWDSPWGQGRPGWHIEDSAMIRRLFGRAIDIHAGGADLMFPHHENEAAQTEALTRQPMAEVWMHGGLVRLNGQKMSKSTGNSVSIRSALKLVDDPMAIRLMMLMTHYRRDMNLNGDSFAAAQKTWTRFRSILEGPLEERGKINREVLSSYSIAMSKALDDDLNTAVVIGLIFKASNERLTRYPEMRELALEMSGLLGIHLRQIENQLPLAL
jgi:cysteinyl-tRNA synthetase